MDAPMNIPCAKFFLNLSSHRHHPIETRQSVDGAGDKQSIGGEAKITADEDTNKGAKAWHNFHA
jgi:hypothetical protein